MATRAIWKFQLAISKSQEIEMPEDAVVLSAAGQNDRVCVWALVEPDRRKVKRTFRVMGTGHQTSLCSLGRFIGTALIYGGTSVWHVFLVGEMGRSDGMGREHGGGVR